MIRAKLYTVGLLIAASTILTGCGSGGGVAVTGKAVNGAKEYSPATDGDLNITLASEGGGKDNGSGKVEEDGTFTIKTASGGGLPPGKYKVTVTRYPSKAEMKPGVHPSPKNVTLPDAWDVSSSNSSFTLDAAKLK
jgi:hypothetical protein